MNRLVSIVLAILIGSNIIYIVKTHQLSKSLEKTQLLYADSEENNKVCQHEILFWKEKAISTEAYISVLKDAQKKNDSIVNKIYKKISSIKTTNTCGPTILEEVQIIK